MLLDMFVLPSCHPPTAHPMSLRACVSLHWVPLYFWFKCGWCTVYCCTRVSGLFIKAWGGAWTPILFVWMCSLVIMWLYQTIRGRRGHTSRNDWTRGRDPNWRRNDCRKTWRATERERHTQTEYTHSQRDMTLDMTDIKAVWCSSRRNIEEESGSLILYTQNPYVMMMTWDHGQSSSRRGFVLSSTPSPHPMFPIPIPWKFKQKKNTKFWLTVDKLDIFTLSLLFFSSSPAGLCTALRPTPCSWRYGRSNNIPRGQKKYQIYYAVRTIAHPCMRDLFGCLKEQIEFKMRERECVPARNTRT